MDRSTSVWQPSHDNWPKSSEEPPQLANDDASLDVQTWLATDLQLQNMELSATGWEKQFVIMYGQTTYDFINDNWQQWLSQKFVSNETFNKQLDDFMRENNVNQKYRPSSIKINNALREFGLKNNFGFEKNYVERVDQFNTQRGRLFLADAPF